MRKYLRNVPRNSLGVKLKAKGDRLERKSVAYLYSLGAVWVERRGSLWRKKVASPLQMIDLIAFYPHYLELVEVTTKGNLARARKRLLACPFLSYADYLVHVWEPRKAVKVVEVMRCGKDKEGGGCEWGGLQPQGDGEWSREEWQKYREGYEDREEHEEDEP